MVSSDMSILVRNMRERFISILARLLFFSSFFRLKGAPKFIKYMMDNDM